MRSKGESADTINQSLQLISGVGPKLAQKFHDIGIKRISDLKGKRPEESYSQMCARQGVQIDRCVLYVCRSSVYFAETEHPDLDKIKWWCWKDKK
jgi:hypothetical protein